MKSSSRCIFCNSSPASSPPGRLAVSSKRRMLSALRTT
nr:MAG TPA: hypothetical protein [Caudoviricetes sp.]